MKIIRYVLGVFLIAFILVACSGLPANMQPPRLTIAGIDLAGMTLMEQRYQLQLRVQNPNNFALPIRALDYELEVNGHPFASGLSNRPVTIPEYGSEILQVEAVSNLSGLFNQLKDLQRSGTGNVTYRLKGTARVGNNDFAIPFNQTGEVALPSFLPFNNR